MKTDLATAIGAAVLGVIISYFVCNLFIGELSDFSYKTVESTVDANVETPDPEIFNYKALNPTVEVYVGDCEQYDEEGNWAEPEDDNNDDNKNDGEQKPENP